MPREDEKQQGYDYVPEWQTEPVPLREEPESELDRYLKRRVAQQSEESDREPGDKLFD